jgi:hypothetical protein
MYQNEPALFIKESENLDDNDRPYRIGANKKNTVAFRGRDDG